MKSQTRLLVIGVSVLLGFILPLVASEYTLTVLSLALIYAIIATGYNVLFGYAGQFSFGHMAFAGLGAYTCSLLVTKGGWPYVWALLAGMTTVSFLAAAVGYPGLALRGHFFGISTLAVGESVVLLLTNLERLTGGTQGLLVLQRPRILGFEISSPEAWYYTVLTVFLCVTLVVWIVITKTTLGKAWIAVRGDEDLAEALGVHSKVAKLTAFVVGSTLAALGGCLYAPFMSCLTPEQFGVSGTIEVLMMVLIGGRGTVVGPLLGSLLLTWVPQVLRMGPQLRLVTYGLILVVVILVMPRGVMGLVERRREGTSVARVS
ncbi:MAG: branched-chain amino acid ABC transporter permease [Bacillota bacterium]